MWDFCSSSGNNNSMLECNNTQMKSKSLSNLARNLTRAQNALQPKFHDTNLYPINQSSGITYIIILATKTTPSLLLPKTVPCVLSEERIAILKQSKSNPHLLIN